MQATMSAASFFDWSIATWPHLATKRLTAMIAIIEIIVMIVVSVVDIVLTVKTVVHCLGSGVKVVTLKCTLPASPSYLGCPMRDCPSAAGCVKYVMYILLLANFSPCWSEVGFSPKSARLQRALRAINSQFPAPNLQLQDCVLRGPQEAPSYQDTRDLSTLITPKHPISYNSRFAP